VQPQDLAFLERALNAFIDAGIMRASNSRQMEHFFRISANEIKAATGRERLQGSIIQEYQTFFANYGVAAEYENAIAAFDIRLNLQTCVLNHTQAANFATAVAHSYC
jgi:hypothetical protein